MARISLHPVEAAEDVAMARSLFRESAGHPLLFACARLTGMDIRIASTDQEFDACFDVVSALRPHLDRDGFPSLVRRLASIAGFQLAYLDNDGIQCVAGFRISEWLAGGRYLEIEDLVSREDARSKGHGGRLFDWLVEHARAKGCDHVRLVSRLSRLQAHEFYKRKGMTADAFYFSLPLVATTTAGDRSHA